MTNHRLEQDIDQVAKSDDNTYLEDGYIEQRQYDGKQAGQDVD